MLLVTGGLGYIGSHTIVELLADNYPVVAYDNLSNSSKKVLDRIEKLSNKKIIFIEGDIRDGEKLESLFSTYQFKGVIHFAGLKSVSESVNRPLKYYDNNVSGTINLLNKMDKFNVRTFIFSSSATVYGDLSTSPLKEDMPTGVPTNAYGASKLAVENILNDVCSADSKWSIARLRYFNPVGAHPSGEIGEQPSGVPANLMPFITQAAIGERKRLKVFGGDYPTIDGTGVRDYIHVVDLAKGHVSALKKCEESRGMFTVNLGTGAGYSVLQMIHTFESVNGVTVPYDIVDRRQGDIATCFANTDLAKVLLKWRATKNLEDMCRDSWNWQVRVSKMEE